MHSPDRLPVHHTPFERRKLRYYAHRVHESFSSKVAKVLCALFLALLFLAGVVVFIFWLSLRPHRPRFHIHDFSIPGLDQPTGFQNAQIFFNVTARNPNHKIEFSYGAVEGAVYYRDQRIGSTTLSDPFIQDPKSTTVMSTVLSGATLTVDSQRWREFTGDRSQGKVMFRLDISSTFKFQLTTWDSKFHRMHANCDIGVGTDGIILAVDRNKRCPVYFT